MISFRSQGIAVLLKIYVAIALVAATVLSPLTLSFIPVLLLAWHVYSWRWPVSVVINLLTEYFLFFAMALLFTPHISPAFSLLLSLPVLLLIDRSLKEAAALLTYQDSGHARRPTSVYLTLLLIAIAVLVLAWLLGSLTLLLACAAVTAYLGILGVIVWRWLPLKPVEEDQVFQRMVAGSKDQLRIELTARTKVGGLLFLESPYEWLKVSPDILSFEDDKLMVEVTLTPSLSGPSVVNLKGQVTDIWGLIRVSFELEPVRLYVIPRAKYAAWLANRYLAMSKPGTLPLVSNIEAMKPLYGLRRGVEYYGSQLYQPGDSLKNIDWKHSLKYNEMITKEFTEFQGQSAVILINLSVGDAEDADKLASNTIITALSLAEENIPAALAAYTNEDVKVVTTMLQPRQLLLQSLQVAQEMVTFINPVKYLNPPDITRLRANISRIRFAKSQAAEVLAQLLQLEYKSINNNAKLNPATKALEQAFAKVDKKSNVVIISNRNHDAEALAFNTYDLIRKGNAVITI
ncbi:DUF58 domain-containing protein [Chloroflexota bacterium]